MLNSILFNLIERFSFIRKYKIYEFVKDIGFPLIINFLSKFFKEDIDDNLIILGDYSGRLYIDNPKYLFEILNKKTKNQVLWITKDKQIIPKLKNKGFSLCPFILLKRLSF